MLAEGGHVAAQMSGHAPEPMDTSLGTEEAEQTSGNSEACL